MRFPPQLKRFLLGMILSGLHTLLFLLITCLIGLTGNQEVGMFYDLYFSFLDYPLSRLTHLEWGVETYAIGGGILWFLYGFTLQALWSIRSPKGLLSLGTGALGITLFYMVPEWELDSMPPWNAHWKRGTEAREAYHLDRAIHHVSEATELCPTDEPLLDGIWNYLGRLYVEQKDYDKAEHAFLSSLAVVSNNQTAIPRDFLDCHNQLASFYARIEASKSEAKHLHEAIKYNRIVYNRDSTQEASCWYRLAKIAMKNGQIDEAIPMIDNAIDMEAGSQNRHDWSLKYMKDQRAEWKIKQSREVKATQKADHE